MKKILLATTMLAGTAGFAAAEVTVSGYAEMGVVGGDTYSTSQFWQDIEVTFSMSGETDGGLSFGAAIDLDEGNVNNTHDGNDDNGSDGTSVYISGSFGKLTMGDTDGGFDWALSETGMGTSLTDDHTSHAGYSGNSGLDGDHDGQVVRYEYSAGDFAAAISGEIDDTGNDDAILGLGVKYSLSGIALGVGYQTDGFDDIIGVSAAGEAGAVKYVVSYTDLDSDGTHMGLGLGYTSGALMVSMNYGVFESTGGTETDGYGLVANYDLGGGAVVMAGYASDMDGGTAGDQNQWSLGLGMSF